MYLKITNGNRNKIKPKATLFKKRGNIYFNSTSIIRVLTTCQVLNDSLYINYLFNILNLLPTLIY